MTKVMPCSCQHDAQDRLYGAGQRAHNLTRKGDKAGMKVWRCTVCKNEKTKGKA